MPAESPKLTLLDLRHSKLKTIHLGSSPDLEKLIVYGCNDLVELKMPAKSLKLALLDIRHSKLTNLDLRNTPNIERLNLIDCHDLVELQMPSESLILVGVHIRHSKLTTIHLGNTPNLENLTLKGCFDFVELEMPSESPKLLGISLSHSKLRTLDLGLTPNLKWLNLENCYDLVEINVPIGFLIFFFLLALSGCGRFKSFRFDRLLDSCEVGSLYVLHLIADTIYVCLLHPDNSFPKFRFEFFYKEDPASSHGNLNCICRLVFQRKSVQQEAIVDQRITVSQVDSDQRVSRKQCNSSDGDLKLRSLGIHSHVHSDDLFMILSPGIVDRCQVILPQSISVVDSSVVDDDDDDDIEYFSSPEDNNAKVRRIVKKLREFEWMFLNTECSLDIGFWLIKLKKIAVTLFEGIYQHDMHGLLDDLFSTLPMEGNNADTSEGEENTSLNTEPVKNNGTKLNDLLKDVEQKKIRPYEGTYVLSSSTDQETTNNSDWTNDDLTKVKGPEKEGSSSLQQESFKQVPNLNLSSVTNFMNMEVDDLSSIHDNMTGKNPSSASGTSNHQNSHFRVGLFVELRLVKTPNVSCEIQVSVLG
ncbi:Toll/interleukin-1 receptor domain-containing protein [Tanacetum coccineum]